MTTRETSRILLIASYLFFGTWVSFLIIGIAWYFEPLPVHYFQRKLVTPTVPIGSELVLNVVSANTKPQCPVTVVRYVYDAIGKEHRFEQQPRPTVQGYEVHLIVPPGAAIGPARYVAEITWACNPVQAFLPRSIRQEAIWFEILPPDGAKSEEWLQQFGLTPPATIQNGALR